MSRILGRNFRVMLVAAAVTAAWSAGGARISSAQTAEPSADQAVDQARRAQAAGRLDEAIEGYARAYQLGGDPNMLFNMAEAQRQAGHDADAVKTFQTYLRRDRQGVHRESAERQLKELEQKTRGGAVAKPVAPPPVVPPAAPVATAPAVLAPAAPPTTPPAAAQVLPPVMANPAVPAAVAVPQPPARPAPGSPAPSLAPSPPASSTTSAATVPTVDLTTTARPPAPSAELPMPRWVPWTLGVATLALGTAATMAGLSASHRFDELNTTCGRTAQGCGGERIDDVKGRARRANILWALTGVAAVATGITVYANASAAGVAGLWAF